MDYRDSFIVPPHWVASGTNRRWNRYERITATDGHCARASVFMVEAGAVYYWTVMVEFNGYCLPGLVFPWSTLWGACRCADRVLDDLFSGVAMNAIGDGWASHQIARWYSYRRGVDGVLESHFIQTASDVIEYAVYLEGKLTDWGAAPKLADACHQVGIAFVRPLWRKVTPESYRLSVAFGAGRRLTVDLFERTDESYFWIIGVEGRATPYKQEERTDVYKLTDAIERAETEAALFIQAFADEQAASAATLSRRSIEQIIAAGVATYDR